eukprot:scaffold7774_cov258-Pinguiococcus_pyrenoidosus.AAC.1
MNTTAATMPNATRLVCALLLQALPPQLQQRHAAGVVAIEGVDVLEGLGLALSLDDALSAALEVLEERPLIQRDADVRNGQTQSLGEVRSQHGVARAGWHLGDEHRVVGGRDRVLVDELRLLPVKDLQPVPRRREEDGHEDVGPLVEVAQPVLRDRAVDAIQVGDGPIAVRELGSGVWLRPEIANRRETDSIQAVGHREAFSIRVDDDVRQVQDGEHEENPGAPLDELEVVGDAGAVDGEIRDVALVPQIALLAPSVLKAVSAEPAVGVAGVHAVDVAVRQVEVRGDPHGAFHDAGCVVGRLRAVHRRRLLLLQNLRRERGLLDRIGDLLVRSAPLPLLEAPPRVLDLQDRREPHGLLVWRVRTRHGGHLGDVRVLPLRLVVLGDDLEPVLLGQEPRPDDFHFFPNQLLLDCPERPLLEGRVVRVDVVGHERDGLAERVLREEHRLAGQALDQSAQAARQVPAGPPRAVGPVGHGEGPAERVRQGARQAAPGALLGLGDGAADGFPRPCLWGVQHGGVPADAPWTPGSVGACCRALVGVQQTRFPLLLRRLRVLLGGGRH